MELKCEEIILVYQLIQLVKNKPIILSLVLVQPRKKGNQPDMTEKLLSTKVSTNKIILNYSVYECNNCQQLYKNRIITFLILVPGQVNSNSSAFAFVMRCLFG